MTEVKVIKTIPLYPNSIFIQWNIVPDKKENSDYYISVYRSGGPEGPWSLLAENLKNAYNFVDTNFRAPAEEPVFAFKEGVNLFSLSKQIYYRIDARNETMQVFSSPPHPIEPDLDIRTRLLKRKMQFDAATAFRVFNGIPLSVLKRKHWGVRCPLCYDPSTKEGLQEHCRACYGTSFKDGYWEPVNIIGRKDVAPVQTQMSPHGKTDRAVTTFTVLDYPKIENGDVVLDLRKNDRYLIEMVTTTELRGIVVHQKITGSLLSRDAVEYTIPGSTAATPRLY